MRLFPMMTLAAAMGALCWMQNNRFGTLDKEDAARSRARAMLALSTWIIPREIEGKVDQAIDESFPTSDPPAY